MSYATYLVEVIHKVSYNYFLYIGTLYNMQFDVDQLPQLKICRVEILLQSKDSRQS